MECKPSAYKTNLGGILMCGNNCGNCGVCNWFTGNNWWWIIILLLLFCNCGGGNTFGGCGCGNNWNNCGCDNDRCC